MHRTILLALRKNNIEYFETKSGSLKIPGKYRFKDLTSVFYEIAFKLKMQRMRNCFGFLNSTHRLYVSNSCIRPGECWTQIKFEKRNK